MMAYVRLPVWFDEQSTASLTGDIHYGPWRVLMDDMSTLNQIQETVGCSFGMINQFDGELRLVIVPR